MFGQERESRKEYLKRILKESACWIRTKHKYTKLGDFGPVDAQVMGESMLEFFQCDFCNKVILKDSQCPDSVTKE